MLARLSPSTSTTSGFHRESIAPRSPAGKTEKVVTRSLIAKPASRRRPLTNVPSREPICPFHDNEITRVNCMFLPCTRWLVTNPSPYLRIRNKDGPMYAVAYVWPFSPYTSACIGGPAEPTGSSRDEAHTQTKRKSPICPPSPLLKSLILCAFFLRWAARARPRGRWPASAEACVVARVPRRTRRRFNRRTALHFVCPVSAAPRRAVSPAGDRTTALHTHAGIVRSGQALLWAGSGARAIGGSSGELRLAAMLVHKVCNAPMAPLYSRNICQMHGYRPQAPSSPVTITLRLTVAGMTAPEAMLAALVFDDYRSALFFCNANVLVTFLYLCKLLPPFGITCRENRCI